MEGIGPTPLCCHAKVSRARFMSEVSRNVAIAGFHVAVPLVARSVGGKKGGFRCDWQLVDGVDQS